MPPSGIPPDFAPARSDCTAACPLHILSTSAPSSMSPAFHISLDAGLLRASDVEQIAPYAGVNVYFRPVNKNAPLRLCEEDCWRRRLSLTVGITYTSLEEEGRVGDLFDGHSALVGVGARVTDYWRITMGALLLRSRGGDDDTELKLNATPALSTSIDIHVVGLLGKVGSTLFP